MNTVRGPSAGHVSRVAPLVLVCIIAPVALAWPAASPSATVVSAFVWDAVGKPVANVTVALRNLGTARVERTSNSDEGGHVSFRGIDTGTYVLEVVNARGAVIATGQTLTVEVGESVATFVRLPAKSPWYAELFQNVGAVAVATAAGLGATAVGTTGQPQSPGR